MTKITMLNSTDGAKPIYPSQPEVIVFCNGENIGNYSPSNNTNPHETLYLGHILLAATRKLYPKDEIKAEIYGWTENGSYGNYGKFKNLDEIASGEIQLEFIDDNGNIITWAGPPKPESFTVISNDGGRGYFLELHDAEDFASKVWESLDYHDLRFSWVQIINNEGKALVSYGAQAPVAPEDVEV